jgi:hypothetical protein
VAGPHGIEVVAVRTLKEAVAAGLIRQPPPPGTRRSQRSQRSNRSSNSSSNSSTSRDSSSSYDADNNADAESDDDVSGELQPLEEDDVEVEVDDDDELQPPPRRGKRSMRRREDRTPFRNEVYGETYRPSAGRMGFEPPNPGLRGLSDTY